MASRLDIETLENVGSLEFIAKQVVEGFITGLHKSPFHGFSVEFAEHRLYNTGESVRHVDWKLFAKTDKMFVKRYEEETNLRCYILLDVSSSMYFPLREKKSTLNKITFSVYVAAALMNLMIRQRDAIGLATFADTTEEKTEIKSTPAHLQFLYSLLEKYLPENRTESFQKGSKIAETLNRFAEQIHKRSLVIIFSDMFDSTEEAEALFSALQHLKYKKNEVLLFHVCEKSREISFDFENRPYRFIDMESKEEIKLNPSQIKAHYKEAMARFLTELKLKCEQYHIDFIEADIQEGFLPVLQSYLIKRQKLG